MTQSKIKIAVTGGIGSGKSAVCKIIGECGYKVFSCDKIYADLLTEKDFLVKLKNELGEEYFSCGKLDRKKLSAAVFSDENLLKKLNGLTHPAIIEKALSLMDGYNLSFCEVPLLFENAFEKFFDGVIVVLRDKEERVRAVSKRDNISENNVLLRINRQYNYDIDDFAKYYVIHNSGNLDDLTAKTAQILQKIVS